MRAWKSRGLELSQWINRDWCWCHFVNFCCKSLAAWQIWPRHEPLSSFVSRFLPNECIRPELALATSGFWTVLHRFTFETGLSLFQALATKCHLWIAKVLQLSTNLTKAMQLHLSFERCRLATRRKELSKDMLAIKHKDSKKLLLAKSWFNMKQWKTTSLYNFFLTSLGRVTNLPWFLPMLWLPPARPRVQCAGSLGSGPMNWRSRCSNIPCLPCYNKNLRKIASRKHCLVSWHILFSCCPWAYVYRKVARVSSPFECK